MTTLKVKITFLTYFCIPAYTRCRVGKGNWMLRHCHPLSLNFRDIFLYWKQLAFDCIKPKVNRKCCLRSSLRVKWRNSTPQATSKHNYIVFFISLWKLAQYQPEGARKCYNCNCAIIVSLQRNFKRPSLCQLSFWRVLGDVLLNLL